MAGYLRRGYNHYWSAVDSLPSYMQKNLNDMPNNKGYLWRGVTFYGALPEEVSDETIIFEKKYNKLLVHHYKNGTHEIIEKQLKDKIFLKIPRDGYVDGDQDYRSGNRNSHGVRGQDNRFYNRNNVRDDRGGCETKRRGDHTDRSNDDKIKQKYKQSKIQKQHPQQPQQPQQHPQHPQHPQQPQQHPQHPQQQQRRQQRRPQRQAQRQAQPLRKQPTLLINRNKKSN